MIWPIERKAVGEHLADVGNELVGVVITRVGRIRIGFLRVGRRELALDGPKIHWILDDSGIVGNVQGDRVNGMEERRSILHLSQRTDSRKTKPMLL